MKKLIVSIVFMIGLIIFCYPYINGFISDEMLKQSIVTFKEQVELVNTQIKLNEDLSVSPLDSLYHEITRYNESLYETKQDKLVDPFSYEQSSFDLTAYGLEENMIGIIDIPKMQIELPIYLGASKGNLNKGAVHLSETSLPIGGKNTNTVIAAHRGWYGKTLFKEIDNLTYGDEVLITNLWETLVYRVVDIELAWPDEINKILIQEGRDLVTLMTCHPPGSNSQRYLVYLERVEKS